MDWLKRNWLKRKFQQKISSSARQELIQVDPSKLRFPFLPDERMRVSISIKLVNITDNYVVFHPRYDNTNEAEYYTRPNGGILPPRSTQEFLVTRVAKNSAAQSIECDDKYILYSTTVSESFSNSEHGNDLGKFYENQAGQIWHRRELGVVLYPAYQQGSPDSMPKTEISSSARQELIQVDPSELRFPFLPDERMQVSISIKLVNITDNYVVFYPRYDNTNVAWYYTRPNGAILPPRSTQEFLVTREAKKSVAQSIECDDKYILYITTVCESFSNSKHGSDLGKFYTNQAGQIWHRRYLGVVLYPAYQHESPHGIPHTEISSSAQHELIQVDPNELRFPFLPNAMLSASSSIKVVNATDNWVVFVTRPRSANVAWYYTRPDGGILPPRSTQEFLVKRTTKKSVAQSIECDDKYILYSTTVSESFSNSQHSSDLGKFYDEQGGQIWHRSDLGVVLYPAYQQGSPDGTPHTEISSSARHELIQDERMQVSISIKLVNITDNYVVFHPRYDNTNVAEYDTRPNGAILPPRSTQEFLVTREAKKSVAQSIQCDDVYTLYSTAVTESFSNSKYSSGLDKFYDEQGGQIWHWRDLGVVLYPAYQLRCTEHPVR